MTSFPPQFQSWLSSTVCNIRTFAVPQRRTAKATEPHIHTCTWVRSPNAGVFSFHNGRKCFKSFIIFNPFEPLARTKNAASSRTNAFYIEIPKIKVLLFLSQTLFIHVYVSTLEEKVPFCPFELSKPSFRGSSRAEIFFRPIQADRQTDGRIVQLGCYVICSL